MKNQRTNDSRLQRQETSRRRAVGEADEEEEEQGRSRGWPRAAAATPHVGLRKLRAALSKWSKGGGGAAGWLLLLALGPCLCWLSGARGRGGAEAVLFIMPEVQSCYCKRRPSSQSPIPMKEAEAASRSSKHARFAAGRAMESATRYVHNAYIQSFGLAFYLSIE